MSMETVWKEVVVAVSLAILLAGCGTGVSHNVAGVHSQHGKSTKVVYMSEGGAFYQALTNLQRWNGYEVSFKGTEAQGPLSFNVVADGKGDLQGSIEIGNESGNILVYKGNLYVQGQQLFAMFGMHESVQSALNWLYLGPGMTGSIGGLSTSKVLAECLQSSFATPQKDNQFQWSNGTKHTLQFALTGSNTGAGSAVIQYDNTFALLGWTVTRTSGESSSSQSSACMEQMVLGGIVQGPLIGSFTLSPSLSVHVSVPANVVQPASYDKGFPGGSS
ncbi:MAG: hypothetical protein ACP5OR_02030 [Candidatus Dormibacteria bacterium]